jgi:N-hydroxyarylamine O-acetyltransferase
MLTDPDIRPNHGSVVVRLLDQEWLVDSSMLFDDPLPLPPPGVTVERDDPVHPIAVVGGELDWTVTWRPAHADVRVACELSRSAADRERWDRAHDFTRSYSLFNQAIYARRNTDDGIVAFGRGKLVERALDGSLRRRDIAPADVATTLVENFGFSTRIVALLPPDSTGTAFL